MKRLLTALLLFSGLALSQTTVKVQDGGTGLRTYSQGDMIYYNSGNAFSTLGKYTLRRGYVSNHGTSNNPLYEPIDLTLGVTGLLPDSNINHAITPTWTGLHIFQAGLRLDSIGLPSVPPQGDLNLVPRGSLGLFLQYHDGSVHNLDSAGGGGGGITALTGDVTATGPGSVAATLANVVTAGTNTKITFNAKGLVTGSAVADLSGSDVTGTLAAARFPALTGDVTTSAGSLATAIKSDANLPGNPTTTTQSATNNSTRVATTAYVDAAVTASNPAIAVQAATTSASNTSGFAYNNGAGGIGATLTGPNNTAFTVDGFTFTALGQRVLVKNDTQSPSGAFNGMYSVTTLQGVLQGVVLTRTLDYNQPSDINNTGAIPVVNGTVNASTSWLLTSAVATVGTDPLTYVQFSYAPSNIITNSTAAGGDLSGVYPNPTIANSAVTNAKIANSTIDLTSKVTGLLPLANGGTNANLSGTGGAGQYLKQSSSGAAVTVGTIAAADLPGSFSGFANPSGLIGLSAVNGVATTADRSDATHAIDQAITPTWTNRHAFTKGIDLSNPNYGYANLTIADTTAGQDQFMFNASKPTSWFLTQGSNASPDTIVGPIVKIVKTQQITTLNSLPNRNNADDENLAAFLVEETNTATDSASLYGIVSHVQGNSTVGALGGATSDIVAYIGVARGTNGHAGVATGAYFEGRSDTTLKAAIGLEVRCANYSSRTFLSSVGSSTAPDTSSGIWMTANGKPGRSVGSAMTVAGIYGIHWKYGVVARPSGIDTTFLLDNSSAANSIQINGTHSTAAIGIASGSGRVGIGTITPAAQLEVKSNGSADPLVQFGNASNSDAISIKATNVSGNTKLFVAAGADGFVTGTVAGDNGFLWTPTKKLWFTEGTNPIMVIDANTQRVGVGTSTPTTSLSVFEKFNINSSGQIPKYDNATSAAGTFLRQDGTVYRNSTLTLPNAATTGDALIATGSNAIGVLAAVADGSVVASKGTSTAPAYKTLLGTTNQVTVTSNAGNFTFSTPQNTHTTATPQFARMGLGVAADATALLTVVSGATGGMTYAYESIASEKATDNKVGIFTASTDPANNGASITLGYTAYADANSLRPGAEFQLIAASASKDSYLRFNSLQRNTSSGTVQNSVTDNLKIFADGRVLINPTGNATTTASPSLSVGSSTTTSYLNIGTSAQFQVGSTGLIPKYGNSTPGAGKVLIGDGTTLVLSTPTYPNASASSGKTIRSDGTNWIASTATLSDAPSTANKWLRSDGTNWITSTSTLSDAPSTAGKIVVSDGTNWITSTPTYPNAASPTSRKIITADGTNWVASTETWATPGAAGNELVSDGTNWISSEGGWTTSKVSGSDATTTGQSLVDVTGLTFTAAASTLYEVDAILYVTTSAVTTGTEYGINSTGGSPVVEAVYTGSLTTTTGAVTSTTANNTADATAYLTTSAQSGIITIRAVVNSGTGSPVISIRHLKVTSGTSTVKIGSRMRVRIMG